MNGSRRILLIEHEPNLARLFQGAMEDEGLEVDVVIEPEDVVETARQHQPSLLLLDLVPPERRAYEVLDALRTDESTRGIPVVALTTMSDLSGPALASYNVREVLTKPFDLDDFIQSIREHASRPTLLAEVAQPRPSAGDFLDYAERILATRARHIVFRWMQRIRMASPWRELGLPTAELINYAPRVLELIDVRLHYRSHEELFRQHPDALERAAGHAHHRMQQGVGLTVTTDEYVILREELWRELEAHGGSEASLGFYQGERAINGTIDAVILETLRVYQQREEQA